MSWWNRWSRSAPVTSSATVLAPQMVGSAQAGHRRRPRGGCDGGRTGGRCGGVRAERGWSRDPPVGFWTGLTVSGPVSRPRRPAVPTLSRSAGYVRDVADLRFYFDPVCPFAWMTSKWVRMVAAQRDYDVDWRFISLRLLNAHVDYAAHFPPEYEAGHTAGLRLLRVAARTRAEHGPRRRRPAVRGARRRASSTPHGDTRGRRRHRGTREFARAGAGRGRAARPSWPTRWTTTSLGRARSRPRPTRRSRSPARTSARRSCTSARRTAPPSSAR